MSIIHINKAGGKIMDPTCVILFLESMLVRYLWLYPQSNITLSWQCSFIVILEPQQCESSSCVIFQNCFGCSAFSYKFQKHLVNFCEISWWDFDWNCVESRDQFGENKHLNCVFHSINMVYLFSSLGLSCQYTDLANIFQIQT